jgi:putative heme-binding domain-containing protein
VKQPLWPRTAGRNAARIIAASFVAIWLAGAAQAQPHAGQYEQADIEYGARLYGGHCVVCHGDRGESIPGVRLFSGKFKNAGGDRDLTRILTDGIAGTAMAPTGLSEAEIVATIAYLRNVNRVDASAANSGDKLRGRALFFGKGDCGRCHRVGAEGPRAGPDLSNIGVQRTAATLRRSLADPNEALLPINRPVRATLRDGTVVSGRRLNEDTATVQLVDAAGRLVSLDKSALRDYSVGTKATMPSYEGVFTETEQADLVAYLLSLQGLE